MSALPPSEDEPTVSSLTAPVVTPHWGAQTGSAFTIRATSSHIQAQPDRVLETLLNTADYPKWNNFVPRVVLTSAPISANDGKQGGMLGEGILFTEHVDMFGSGKSSGLVKMKLLMTTLKITRVKNGKQKFTAVWLGKGYPDWALRSERVHEISQDEDGTVVYDVYETFSGPLATLVKLFVGKALVKRFGQWNDELKAFAEGKLIAESKADARIEG